MSAPGAGWRVVELAEGVLRLVVHSSGPRPPPPADADILLTIDPDPPAPWVTSEDIEAEPAQLAAAAEARPVAAAVLVQVLRMSLALPFEDALVAESLAYSTLLGGSEFAIWRAATPARVKPLSKADASDAPWVRLARGADGLMVTLARADARNAVNARLRDELVEALEFALIDPEAGPVILSGEGPAFSAGGDLNEFGQATDLALAHAVRVRQSPARLVRRLGERLTARLHGPCIGAGIEIPAAAGRVVAAPDAWFRLPEVSMGLIPGAGGTATIPRRIGRERACYMALSGRAIDAATALAWGLVDTVEAAP